MSTGMRFAETMAGTWQPTGERRELPIRFDLDVSSATRLKALGTVSAAASGRIEVGELASGKTATGTLEISPVEHRRVRYTLDFEGDDGSGYTFDGWKSIDWVHGVSSWTTLPGTLTAADGRIIGTATLYFDLADLPRFLGSMRRLRPSSSAAAPAGDLPLEARRWHGEPGRLEVWYDTFTDPATGAGFWLHHEIVVPAGAGEPEGRGWAAVFPTDGDPLWERFGPEPVEEGQYFGAGSVVAEPGRRSGSAGAISWDLTYDDESAPLYTFSRAAWRRELLPAAQIVPSPAARFSGTVKAGGSAFELSAAPGAAARIYGHGNAERWAWLHADLGGGDVLELVAAVGRRPPLSRLAPMPILQLRLGGRDWPANPLLAAPRLRARIGLPEWTVEGTVGDRKIRVTVTLPPARCVSIPYHDPDGSTATCTNSERADARIELWRRDAGPFVREREWTLEGTAHAEVGSRP